MGVELRFNVNACVPLENLEANIAFNENLGVPVIGPDNPALPQGSAWLVPLAVVGGGPSISRYAHALKEWDGPIWAINGAWTWCEEQEFKRKPTLFSIDPHGCLLDIIKDAEAKGRSFKGRRAILATVTDKSVTAYLKEQGCEIILFNMGQGRVETGPTSATCALTLAPIMGHNAVNFFGCESSYPSRSGDHVYSDKVDDPAWMKIECHGGEFVTKPEWFIQAQVMATAMRNHPEHFREHGGGLLHALTQDAGWDLVCVSTKFAEGLEPSEGASMPEVRERP